MRKARQRQLARVVQCIPRRGPGQQAHGIRDKDLPRTGGGADPLSLDDRRSEDVVGLPGHVSRTDAHAHRERDRTAVRLPVDRPLNVPGAGDRGPGRLENGQEAVAERLDLLTAMHGDHIPQPAIVLTAYGVGVLVAQLASHPRGTGEIGEQNGGRRATALRPRRLHGGRRTLPQRRIVGQDRPLDPLELGRRGQAELGVERPHRLPVGIERVALPPCPIEGKHELPAQPLPQRVPRHQGLELGHELAVTSGQEIRLDAILERRGVQPLQRHDLGLRERLEREPGERRAAPLRKRGAQATRGALGQPRGKRPPALVAQRLETLQVQLTGLDLQTVAVRGGHEPARVVPERPAKPRHRHLQRLDGALGLLLAPQVLHEPIPRHRGIPAQQQRRQQRALARTRNLEHAPLGSHLDRPQDSELHTASISQPPADGNRCCRGVAGAKSAPGIVRANPTDSDRRHRMSRCNTIIAAALAAAALAAPTALAQPPDIHAALSEPAPDGHSKQDLRMPDTRDAAHAATPSDHNAARPQTAGNPNISAAVDHPAPASDDDKHATTDDNVTAAEDRALAQERYYESFGKHATTNDNDTTAEDRALAQERHYESYGKPTPPTIATRTVAADTGDGIARLPFLSAVFGALILGLGAGSGLHLLHVRRRYRTRPVT